ncbi:MAG: ABC transporter permease [Bacteroidetes bacterium]|nr:ABC transporter permease [Bacteroidota bacterium]
MFKNYIKLALRHLFKHRLLTFIHVAGLCLGLSSALILFLHVSNEYSYDTYFQDADRIYRVRCDNLRAGEYMERMAVTNGPVGEAIKSMFPEVESMTQLNRDDLDGILANDRYKSRMEQGFFASEDFFKVFSYKLLRGDAKTALSELNSVVLSESMAKRFFGNEDPLNKTLKLNDTYSLKVTGVFQDVPENTHLKFDILIPFRFMFKHVAPYLETDWDSGETNYTYIKLKPGADAALLEQKFVGMVQEKIGPYLKNKNHDKQFLLQPLTSIHLGSHFDSELEANGSEQSVRFFIVIAVLILVIAWINYINLSAAQSFERFKEVGIRMVSGAFKTQIRSQFILEALLLNLISLGLAVLMAYLAAPYFSAYTGMAIRPEIWHTPSIWIIFILTTLGGALLASLYPAFILTAISPVTVLKSKVQSKSGKGFMMRKTLLSFQFLISFILITGTIVVYKQVVYMKNEERGVDIEQTVLLQKPYVFDTTWMEKLDAFKATLNQDPTIKKVCISRYVPGETINYSQGFVKQSDSTNRSSLLLYSNFFDEDFIPLYGLKVIAGRNFLPHQNYLELIINRKALKTLGYNSPEDAINQKVYNEGWKYTHTIVGVIEDFHQRSVKEDYLPMAYMYFPGPELSNVVSVKVNTKDMHRTLAYIEKTWKTFYPGSTFEYTFQDDKYNDQFKADTQFGSIFLFFSSLAIVIACIGLFALTMYSVLQRSKEVAIRKVIGASATTLFRLLTREYFILLGIASMIAIPLVYIIMKHWLQNYANSIELSWFLFLPSVFILILMVLASASFQVIKAIRMNPVRSLKSE